MTPTTANAPPNRPSRRTLLAAMLGAALTPALLTGAPVLAQQGAAWAPTKPIVLIVPFAAGGPSDVVARLVAEPMGRDLGQTIVIENVAGAGGTAGAARLARAEADGHTLLIHHLALAAAPNLYAQLPYETPASFAPVGLVNTGPMLLVGRTSLAERDAATLIPALTGERAAKTTVAHAGLGSNSHLCAVLLAQALKVEFNLVAYRGTGPALTDLVSGQVDLLCDQSTTAIPQVQANSARAFAVTSAERLPSIPNVPTTREAGLPAVDMTIWHGLYAPARTPPAALDRLNAALAKAMAEPTVRERLAATGTTAFPPAEMTREAHAARFAAEIDRWRRTLAAAGVRPAAN